MKEDIQRPGYSGLRNPRPASLRDQAYEIIKHKIIHCEYRPGETLTIADLVGSLDFGRTPIIQAVDRLVVDRLLEVMPRKGIVVTPISLDEFFNIIEVRLLNECQAARWAAEKASDREVEQLDRNVADMHRASGARAVEEFVQLDREFHRILSTAAANPVLGELLGNLHDRSVRFWSISLRVPDHNTRVCEQHAAITKAVRAHDPDAAEAAMRDHIIAFQRNVTRAVAQPRLGAEFVAADLVGPL